MPRGSAPRCGRATLPGCAHSRPSEEPRIPSGAAPRARGGTRLRERLGHYLGRHVPLRGRVVLGRRSPPAPRAAPAVARRAALRRGRGAVAPRPVFQAAFTPTSRGRVRLEFYPLAAQPLQLHRDGPGVRAARGATRSISCCGPCFRWSCADSRCRAQKGSTSRSIPSAKRKTWASTSGAFAIRSAVRSSAASRSTRGRTRADAAASCCTPSRARPSPRASTREPTLECVTSSSGPGSPGTKRARISTRKAGATSSRRNREQLLGLGLWGVPSFRILGRAGEPDYCTWGQDRLWRVEAELRARLTA